LPAPTYRATGRLFDPNSGVIAQILNHRREFSPLFWVSRPESFIYPVYVEIVVNTQTNAAIAQLLLAIAFRRRILRGRIFLIGWRSGII
jgi:hypothetical protein